MYKVKNELAPIITANVFTTIPENHYNLRNYNGFKLPFARTVYHGTESISYLGPKIWDIVPIELKNAQCLNSFKKSIRKWIPNNCPCRLCKRYVDGVGFYDLHCGFNIFFVSVIHIFMFIFFSVLVDLN